MADECKRCLACKNCFCFNPFYSHYVTCPWCGQKLKAIMKKGNFSRFAKTKEEDVEYLAGWTLV